MRRKALTVFLVMMVLAFTGRAMAGTEGKTNTIYGKYAGGYKTLGENPGPHYHVTFIGAGAGYNHINGDSNTILGYQAGWHITKGYANTFLGSEAGWTNASASYNTILGYEAGLWNGGYYNTILGYEAGWHNNGADNTFLGYDAGSNNTTGNHNTFIGDNAGYGNDTGHDNTFLGYQAGDTATTGNYNTFIGDQAGDNNTGGSNTFLGYQAGQKNNGSSNTLIGYQAGALNTTGGRNTFIGLWTGYNTTTGGSNTFLGHAAGYHNTTGARNVFIGHDAGANETGSDKLYIANSNTSAPLLYGEFDNKILTINGQVGIGTQTPSYPLHMASGAYVTTGGVWTDASSREYKDNIKGLKVEDAMETLQGLNPVTFSYKVYPEENTVGFIAEEVPDIIATKDRKGLSSMDIVAVLTKVVQEQQKTISVLAEEIKELKRNMGADTMRAPSFDR